MSNKDGISIAGLIATIIFALIAWQLFIAWKELKTIEQLRNTHSILKRIVDWMLPKNYESVRNFMTLMLISYVVKTIICIRHTFQEPNSKHSEYIKSICLAEIIMTGVLFGITPFISFLFGSLILAIPNLIGAVLLKQS